MAKQIILSGQLIKKTDNVAQSEFSVDFFFRCHIETITGDIATLRDKLRRISSQISATDNAFRQQMEGFIEVSRPERGHLMPLILII